MELAITNFIKEVIKTKKPNFKDLVELVSEKFKDNSELPASDISFVLEHYRSTLLDLWKEEFIGKFEEKSATKEIQDDDVIELLGIFRGLKAFEQTPEILQGTFYNIIVNENKIFIKNDFSKPRKEICNFLAYKLTSLGQQIRNEYEFLTNLIESLRSSYLNFDGFVKGLSLKDFVTESITLYQVARIVLSKNFAIESYNSLREISAKIENVKPLIDHIIRKEVKEFLEELVSKESEENGKKIFLLQRKLLTSRNLNVNLNSRIDEVHIACDILHIDRDLSDNYRGKNIFIVANTIKLHQSSTWNLSGHDAIQKHSSNAGQQSNGDGENGEDGMPGESGGNCEVFSAELKNPKFWTVISNGGNGSNGQNGGDGENGKDGHGIQEDDFKINGKNITNTNFCDLLNKIGISTHYGSRRGNFYEDKLQKEFIFNRNSSKSELLMLIKGSSGTSGALGGFGGFGGHGGYAGKININCYDEGFIIESHDGIDGKTGTNGYNGRAGRDGRDAYVKISSNESELFYGGLDKNLEFEISLASTEDTFSIFYVPLQRYFNISQQRNLPNVPNSKRNDIDEYPHRLASDEEIFYEVLTFVVKNANQNLSRLIKKLEIQEYLSDKTKTIKDLSLSIVKNDFDILFYNILKSIAKFFIIRSAKIEPQVRAFLLDFISDSKIIKKSETVYEIKKKLITSEDINEVNEDFEVLQVICDTLHINSDLSKKFRGKNLSIYANTITIHKNVEWNLSGCDNFLAIKENCGEKKLIINGGCLIIDCNIINNPSLFKVISNGGNASLAKDGIDAEEEDFMINGKTVEDFPNLIKETFNEDGLVKHLVKESNDNYLLLVKGSNAVRGYNGRGEKGGHPGHIEIKAEENTNNREIVIMCETGKSDSARDGRDAFISVKDGVEVCIGLNSRNRYDLMTSNNNSEYSTKYISKFYFPKFSRSLEKETGTDSLALHENIIWVLRNSHSGFDSVITKLDLKKFVDFKTTLTDIAKIIEPKIVKIDYCGEVPEDMAEDLTPSSNDFEIANYNDLKHCAKTFQRDTPDLLILGSIRASIEKFIEPVKITKQSNLLIVKKKVYLSSSLSSLTIDSNITEIHLICDTLHIDSELPQSFRSKTFEIYANFVYVHSNFKWTLSGEEVFNNFSTDAGQESDGRGIDGQDGMAGKCGGNFFLKCNFIENSSALTIESNGSDGKNGQNGGNGRDGENGKDPTLESFKKNKVKWEMYLDPGYKKMMYGAYDLTDKYKSEVKTDDGFDAEVYIQTGFWEDYGIMIVKGENGKEGKSGGLPGYGGEQGYAGEIKVDTEAPNSVKILTPVSGKAGTSGKGGLNGKKGRDGKDMYKYDERNWKNAANHGETESRKYRITYVEKNCNECVYQKSHKKYATVSSSEISYVYEQKQNQSTVSRRRNKHALTQRSPSLKMNDIINEFSKYLSDAKIDNQKIISTVISSQVIDINAFRRSFVALSNLNKDYLLENTQKISVHYEFTMSHQSIQKSTKKSDILVETAISQYSEYLKTSRSEIDSLTKKYSSIKSEMEVEETEVQTQVTVQVKFDPKKLEHLELSDVNDRILYYDLLLTLTGGCKADHLLNVVQKSRFSIDKYKYLIENVGEYKIDKVDRIVSERKDILNACVEKFVKFYGKISQVSEMVKFYELQIKGDRSWQKCTESPQILDHFIETMVNSQPAYLSDFFKNFIKNSQLEVSDIRKICEEKFMLLFFRELYMRITKQNLNTQQSSISFASNVDEFWEQIEFLKNTEEFSSGSDSLDRHFNECGEREIKEILDFFLLNSQNFEIGLPEAIFNILSEYSDELDSIADVLKEYSRKAFEILDEIESDEEDDGYVAEYDDDLKDPIKKTLKIIENTEKMQLEPKSAYIVDTKKENYIDMMEDFYKNDKIINFIKEDIRESGINSILYRSILAQKYNIKITVLVKNFDGTLKVVEQHNYDHDLKFEYFSREHVWNELLKFGQKQNLNVEGSSEYPKEMFILLKNGEFSILEFDMKRYEAHKFKHEIDLQLETIVDVLNNKNVDKSDMPEFLDPLRQKYSMIPNKLLNIFDDEKFFVDTETLIEIILLNFPLTILKYDENGVKKFKIDDNIINEIKKSNEHPSDEIQYRIHNDEEIRDDIKVDLYSISSINGLPVIKAIAIRLFNDQNLQTLREFSLMLKIILDLLSQQNALKHYLAFLILGNEQELWSLELALMKLENLYGLFNTKLKEEWRRNASKIKVKKILELFLKKVSELEKSNDEVDEDGLQHIITNIQYFDADNYDNLRNSNLSSWRLMTTEKYWKKELAELRLRDSENIIDDLKVLFEDLNSKFGTKAKVVMELLKKNRKELSKINLVKFLGDFNTGKWKLSDEAVEILKSTAVKDWNKKLGEYFSTDGSVRKVKEIIKLVKLDDETSPRIKDRIKAIGDQAEEVFEAMSIIKGKKFIEFDESEVKEWIKETKLNVKRNIKPPIVEALAIITRMFQIKTGNKITLRDTQLMSILTMWDSDNGILMQVSTGEGKTFIGVSFAILKVIYGENVDVITSSSILAVRDADENKEFFEFFGISVDHNCHQDIERRKQAYGSQVVYGILGNYQRDYLLTEFFNENFLSGHNFKNILVDEVDSMLLDKGNNILYLSSSLPDIDEIESLFLFIWQYVNQGSNNPEEAVQQLKPEFARKIILESAYGLLDETEIKNMKQDVQSDEIFNKLRIAGVIDDENIICEETYSETRFDNILQGFNAEICEKIKVFCRNKIEAKKQIKIPKYLKKFVLLHLNNWIESAIRAMSLRNENEYIVDRSSTGSKPSADPNIIIMDLDTGTDMTNSQWDEGLHQFLQFKHACRLSLISLKSVFISNVSYFKKYSKLYGMTGTLGSLEERKKTTKMHQIDFVTLPRYVERNFQEYSPVLVQDQSNWVVKIHDEIVTMFDKNRSVLVICETIEHTKEIRKVLLQNSENFTLENVKTYQRDATEFEVKILEPKNVIIATNLAGRGTDIKLSKPLKAAGGLHIILSYLPLNARIENQAFGRASRAGDKGSGRLIIYVNPIETISKMKEKRNHNELQRLDEVNSYYLNFITIEEEFFKKFHDAFRELKQAGEKSATSLTILSLDFIKDYKGFNALRGTDAIKIYLDNFKLQWSFWLDENSKRLEQKYSDKNDLQSSFNKFLSKAPKIHPVKRIEIFKYQNENNFDKAKNVLINDFETDSIAFQYLKCYEMLKRAQLANGYENRTLTDYEKRELIKCLKMINNRIQDRNVRSESIKSIKKFYQESLIPIEAFENQQRILNEIDEIYVDSIQSILGKDISPELMITTEVKLSYMTKELHEEFVKQKAIDSPKISKYYTYEDIKMVSDSNKIRLEDLQQFLEEKKSGGVLSIKKLGESLKTSIKMPSREEFWDTLIKKGILTDEIEYAIVDMNNLYKVDPSIHEEIGTKFTNEKLTLKKNTQIYFASVNTVNDDQNQFKVLLRAFRSQMSDTRFNFLMENDVIQINKRANFNIQKYTELKNGKIFDNFDGIKREEFRQICINYNRIIEKLTKQQENGRKILLSRGIELGLNYPDLELIDSNAEIDILGDDEIYQENISNLITTKFAYRIALEVLAYNVVENSKKDENFADIVIHLHISPHLMVLNDMITNNIIEASKANKDKFDNFDKVRKSLESQDIEQKKLGGYIAGFTTHKTLDFLARNQVKMTNDLDNIQKKIKESIQALSNEEIEVPDVVLKPLSDLVSKEEHREMIELLKLKGFDMVIKVELKKYSATYWWRFSIVMVLAAVQIIVGALLIVLSKGIFYKIGESLIQEGVGDAIFALGTLKTGHFKWSDYGHHKLTSIITTLAFGFIRMGVTKIKWFKKFFKESGKINSYMYENLKDKTSILQLMRSGGEVGKGTTKEVFKLFAKTVGSKVGSAFTQAAISMGTDFVMEKFIDDTTKRIAEYIVERLQGNFWIHDITKTIDKLLEYYTIDDVRQVVFSKFAKISEQQQTWTDIAEKVSNKVDDLIRMGQNISRVLTVTTSLVSKLLELSSVTMFTMNIFNHLNSLLQDVLSTKVDRDKVSNSLADGDAEKLKKEILEHIKTESTQKFKGAINAAAVKPALSFASNAVVDKATDGIKSLINQYKERGYRKKAEKIIDNADDGKISDVDAKKVNKILAGTKDPKLFAELTQLDIPMNIIGIEAAAVVLKKQFGPDFKIEVEYEGRKYVFGEANNKNAQIVSLDLSKGHFDNSNNTAFGNNCMFDAISDNIPVIKSLMSPKEFRNEVANVMVTDGKIINEINSSKKSYFMNIGFYGGKAGDERKRTRNETILEPENETRPKPNRPKKIGNQPPITHGSYEDVRKSIQLREQLYEVHHEPPQACYRYVKEYYGLDMDTMPCLLLPTKLHRDLSSTKFETFRNISMHYITGGRFDLALKMGLIDIQNRAYELFDSSNRATETNAQKSGTKSKSKGKNQETALESKGKIPNKHKTEFHKEAYVRDFPEYESRETLMVKLKDNLNSYVESLVEFKAKKPLLTQEQAKDLKKMINDFGNEKYIPSERSRDLGLTFMQSLEKRRNLPKDNKAETIKDRREYTKECREYAIKAKSDFVNSNSNKIATFEHIKKINDLREEARKKSREQRRKQQQKKKVEN